MKVAIHQPEYWPIPRLLAKWRGADLLVLLDTADFDRESLQHRMKLQDAADQAQWVTIPYVHVGGPQQIRVLEAADPKWPEKHFQAISRYYRTRAKPDALRRVAEWFAQRQMDPVSVAEAAYDSMSFLGEVTHLGTPVVFASALVAPDGGWGTSGTRVLNICKTVKADVYLSGLSGAKLLDTRAFERARIAIEIQAFPQESGMLAGRSGLHDYLMEGPEYLAYQSRA
jgi:hypothetical protein